MSLLAPTLVRRLASTRPRAEQSAPKCPKVNPFGIPLLPEGLRDRLFSREETAIAEGALRSARKSLEKFNLNAAGGMDEFGLEFG